MSTIELTNKTARKAENIIRDAQLAIAAGLIPVFGLIYVLRLVQWYILKLQNPSLVALDGPEPELAKRYRSALHRLWFAVLFWPVLIGFIIPYMAFT